ncbi:M56 family metallopeptidase [Algoriphagus vanfongensis]|uniref:M56 family metallopeptidase n=1 Tax=Algoriphagus vanfongensis TaxID=426371 RepID=UPI00047DA644|nr:M56 family metallopeptidase [Algoriphagus vanfongensis]
MVLLSEQVVPFTFFRYIFVNRQEFEKEELSDAVLEHELAHVQGKHSWDILFIELLLVPFWFHPGLYWAKQSIQLNHEFIADQSALKKWPLHRYQQELLQFAAGKSANGLVSNLNFSLTKKRLEMMKKQSKPAIRAIKLLVLLPMIGLVIYGFSEKEYVLVEKNSGTEPKSIDHSNELNFYLNKDGGFTYEGKVYELTDLKDLLRDFDNTMLINLSVDSGLSMGKLADCQTELRKLDVRKIKYVGNSGIWPPRNERINNLTEYLNDLEAYNEKLETGVHFVKKSESEQEEIMKLFLDLGGRYFRLPIDDKRKAERPVHPYAPYVHLDKDGEVYYKLPKDLTEEEKAQLPPPPPPAQKGNGVTLLKVYRELYYTYELTRNNREHFIYKSKEEREAIFNQFKRVESAYFGLDHNDKMLVKRPTSPQTPYVVLVKDGKEFFKLASELTEEDRKMMGC